MDSLPRSIILFVREEQSRTPFWRGVLPKLPDFTPPHPAHYWRPVRVDILQKLTRDASLQLDMQPEQQAHLGGCPKNSAVTLGLAARTLEMPFYFQPLY